mgnify:CR=1 FL=1
MAKMTNKLSFTALIILFLAGCAEAPSDDGTKTSDRADSGTTVAAAPMPADKVVPELPAITAEMLDSHMSVLASDEFGGRAPGTAGGRKTRDYLVNEMERIGLIPANGDSYEQPVGLVEQTVIPQQSSFSITQAGQEAENLAYGQDIVFWSKQVATDISYTDSDLVFVGFGIVAPEYGWNDYEGIDVTGKTVVMFVNDPGFYLENELFNGSAMTYYGRWTYKYEEAARQGAAGAVVIHETDPAAYGWGVVEGSWSGPQLDLERPDGGASRVKMEAWMSEDAATTLFSAAGLDMAAEKERALSGDFTPAPMEGFTASATLKNVINRNQSANVAGIVKGATAPDEFVLYMAHWDHLGRTFAPIGGGDGSGDLINNGAVDNATGTGALLAIAESFANGTTPPDRSLIFVAVTAEESGLLGSAYYAEDPLVPLAQTIGGINMDGTLNSGPTKDILVIGYGASELEDILLSVTDKRDMVIRPDQFPEKGYFYRSDHISLAKKGVPMLWADAGTDLVAGGEEAGRALADEYTTNRYHKPADNYGSDFNLGALVQMSEIMRDTGAILAYSGLRPNWYEGNEFKAARDAQLSEYGIPNP